MKAVADAKTAKIDALYYHVLAQIGPQLRSQVEHASAVKTKARNAHVAQLKAKSKAKSLVTAKKKAVAKTKAAKAHPHHAKKTPAQKKAQVAKRAIAAKKAVTAKKKRTAAPVLWTLPAGPWLLGGNDCWPSCAVAALANHLLISRGIAATDQEMTELLCAAGGDDEGVFTSDLLEATQDQGLSGVRLDAFRLARPGDAAPGMLAVMEDAPHVVLLTPGGMITWGHEVPRFGVFGEAWQLRWAPGEDVTAMRP